MTAAELKVKIDGELKGLRRALSKAKGQLRGFGQSIGRMNKAASAGVTSALGLGTAITGIGVAAGAASAAAVGSMAGIGIAAAAQSEEVQNAFKGLAQGVTSEMQDLAAPIADVLPDVARQLQGTFDAIAPDLAASFEALAPQIQAATRGLSRFATSVMPGVRRLLEATAPLTRALAQGMGALGRGVAGMLEGLSTGMDGAARASKAFLAGMGRIVRVLGEVMGSIAGVSGSVSEALMPALAEVTTLALRFLEAVLVPMAPAITAVVGGFQRMLAAVREAVGPIGAMTALATPLLAAFTSLSAPVLATVAAVGALAAAGQKLHENWNSVTSWLEGRFPGAIGAAKSALDSFVAGAKDIFGTLLATARPVLTDLREMIGQWVDWASAAWEAWGSEVVSIVSDYFGQAVRQIKTLISITGDTIGAFLNVLTGDWAEAWEDVKSAFQKAWRLIVNTAVTGVRRVLQAMQSLADYVPGFGDAMAGGIETMIESLKDLRIEAEETADAVESSFSGMSSPSFSGGASGSSGGGGEDTQAVPESDVSGSSGLQVPTFDASMLEPLKAMAKGVQKQTAKIAEQPSIIKTAAKEFGVGFQKMASLVKKGGAKAVANFVKMRKRWGKAIKKINNNLERGLEKAISTFASGAGKILAKTGSLEDAGTAVLKTLGGIMKKIGGILIAYGVTMEKFLEAGGLANPFAAIAAGAALVAAGTAISAAMKSGNDALAGGRGGSSGGNSLDYTTRAGRGRQSGRGGPTQSTRSQPAQKEVVHQLEFEGASTPGGDLQYVIQEQRRKDARYGGTME